LCGGFCVVVIPNSSMEAYAHGVVRMCKIAQKLLSLTRSRLNMTTGVTNVANEAVADGKLGAQPV
jgi:hypothetical protein